MHDPHADTPGPGHEGATGDLPRGSVVPGADIWDDLDAEPFDHGAPAVVDLETRRSVEESRAAATPVDDELWMIDAHRVPHVDDDGAHDGSRGVEADDDASTEAFNTKLQRWGTTTVLGASLSGMGIGIEKALFPKEEIQIEIRVDDDTDDRLDPVEVTLGEHPDESVAVLRPWLRDRFGDPDTPGDV